jgi:hypothetical protein
MTRNAAIGRAMRNFGFTQLDKTAQRVIFIIQVWGIPRSENGLSGLVGQT